jgi:hypothetical protein
MTELHNPLFESEKEFLERQRLEYKNALMGDVEQLKEKSERVGTTLLIAGGLLTGAWLISKMISTNESSKKKKKKKKKIKYDVLQEETFQPKMHKPHKVREYDSLIHEQEDDYTISSEHPERGRRSGLARVTDNVVNSELMTLVLQQITAFLLVYISKKVEEYVNVHKNDDIAGAAEPETKDIDFAYYDDSSAR